MNAIIQVSHLIKRYEAHTVLNDISLDVAEGEFVALLGPSGCGKTTLLRIIGGFVEATKGEVKIDGQDMAGIPPNERPANMVFQNYALFPHLTVAENVAFGPRRRRHSEDDIRQTVRECLDMVNMGSFHDRLPSQLSGGQQQRVALARAIANKPRVLLLDEPLGALDLQLRKQMQVELKQLQQKLGITFILVTHDQEEALVMADRIVVMNAGRIEQIGSGIDIYENPRSRYVASFIGEANIIPCRIAEDGRLGLGNAGPLLPYSVSADGKDPALLIRPEKIVLGKADPDSVQMTGEVTGSVFIGNATRVFLRLGEDVSVTTLVEDRSFASTLTLRQEVSVSWRKNAARVLVD